MGDDRDRDDRPRRSWREIDQMRDGSRGRRDPSERRPRSREEAARSAAATKQYLNEADKLFASGKGGHRGEQLARAMHDAHGSEGFSEACSAYLSELGLPTDPKLLSLLLDTGDPELIVPALEALLVAREEGRLETSGGLKSQVRMLAEDRHDGVAGAAEDLLAQL